jgi:Domain of unknown function (DUF4190)
MTQGEPVGPAPRGPVKPMNHGYAVTSLVCGIAALACSGIFTGIPAIILGMMAPRKIAESGGRFGGLKMARWGVILGWISVPLTILQLVILWYVVAIFQHILKGMSGTGGTPF